MLSGPVFDPQRPWTWTVTSPNLLTWAEKPDWTSMDQSCNLICNILYTLNYIIKKYYNVTQKHAQMGIFFVGKERDRVEDVANM